MTLDKPIHTDWSDCFEATRDKSAQPLLVEAVKYVRIKGRALDLGAGALRSSKYLIDQGFDVTAIDSSPLFAGEAQRIQHAKFHYEVQTYDLFKFQNRVYDLIVAIHALSFNPPETFANMFDRLKRSIKTDGILCCTFFGMRDEWKRREMHMTFHDRQEIQRLLRGFEIVSLYEDEKPDGETPTGKPRYTHVFRVIARKLSRPKIVARLFSRLFFARFDRMRA